jgi:hypothetical protein
LFPATFTPEAVVERWMYPTQALLAEVAIGVNPVGIVGVVEPLEPEKTNTKSSALLVL